MESSVDDGIEVLSNSGGEVKNDNSSSGDDQIDSDKPLRLYSRGVSHDELVSIGSIHALQTAFSALQKKHNAEVKRNSELMQVNRSMQRALVDVGNQRVHSHSMDEIHSQNQSSVHAAGGTSEEENAVAENCAQQGYVQYMQRELLIANNTIKLMTTENERLKRTAQDFEQALLNSVKERDKMGTDLGERQKEQFKKDEEIAELKDRLQEEYSTNLQLRELLTAKDRNTNLNTSDIQELKSQLTVAFSDTQKLRKQVGDLEKLVQEKEKERSMFEVQIKQLRIELDISRNQKKPQESQDDSSDETDVKILNQALRILEGQRSEISDLKQKFTEQQGLISQIQSKRQLLAEQSLRPQTQGASVICYQEQPRPSELSQNEYVPISHHSMLFRTRSDHSDYRQPVKTPETSQIKNSYGNQPMGQSQMSGNSSASQYRPSSGNQQMGLDRTARIPPRVNDNIVPTGNQKITPMFALESNQKQRELVSTVHTGTVGLSNSRTRNVGESNQDLRFGLAGMASPRQTVQSSQSSQGTTSPRLVGSPRVKEVEYANFSPRLVQQNRQVEGYSPGSQTRVQGARMNYMEMHGQPLQQVPNRMTQSEIIIREHSAESSPMTRSVLDPVQPLNIPLSGSSGYLDHMHGEIGLTSPRRESSKASQHVYQNQLTEMFTGPDYENIYNPNMQTETKRPVEEHEDEAFNRNDQRTKYQVTQPVQEEIGENVAAVKICPVCNQEFSRLRLDQFQMHVVECFETNDESPVTLQATPGTPQDDDRTCPMCNETFPLTISQETYEQHVLSHFGDEPLVDRFEMLDP